MAVVCPIIDVTSDNDMTYGYVDLKMNFLDINFLNVQDGFNWRLNFLWYPVLH